MQKAASCLLKQHLGRTVACKETATSHDLPGAPTLLTELRNLFGAEAGIREEALRVLAQARRRPPVRAGRPKATKHKKC